jgi:hypothetical protein
MEKAVKASDGEAQPLIQQVEVKEGNLIENEKITRILLNDGWHNIWGFQMFRTQQNVPFMQFDMLVEMEVCTIQVFPNAVYGFGYKKGNGNDDTAGF